MFPSLTPRLINLLIAEGSSLRNPKENAPPPASISEYIGSPNLVDLIPLYTFPNISTLPFPTATECTVSRMRFLILKIGLAVTPTVNALLNFDSTRIVLPSVPPQLRWTREFITSGSLTSYHIRSPFLNT